MLLQLVIDRPDGLAVVSHVTDLVDSIAVGTPMLKRFGLAAISTVRELAPDVPIMVDTKTVDGGGQEAEMVFNAGAMFLTVLSVASRATFEAASAVAEKYGAHIVVDAIAEGGASVKERDMYPERCSVVAIHTTVDAGRAGGKSRLRHIGAVMKMRELGYRVALVGDFAKGDLDAVVEAAPDILVVGAAITDDVDPRGTAEWIVSRLPDRGHGWPWEAK